MPTIRRDRRLPRRRRISRPTAPITLALEFLEERCQPSSSASAYGQLPLAFEPNLGQAAGRIGYLARGSGYTLGLNAAQAELALHGATAADTVQVRLIGANAAAPATAQDLLPGVSNYLIGNDPSKWHTNVPNYGQVEYAKVYPGVNLVYHGNQGQLEYDFIVQPGSSPGFIRLAVDGAHSLSLDGHGDLVVHTAGGDVIEQAPTVYQQIAGSRRTIAGRFVLENNDQVGFAVGAYDASAPLTIDPVLNYSSYLGGSQQDDALGIAVDTQGSAYVVGETYSSDFPTVNPLQAHHGADGGNNDAFVAKLDPTGTRLIYSTYLGGTGLDMTQSTGGIAVDSAGDAYIAGETTSTDFPTAGAFQQHHALDGNMDDGFVTKLNPTGQSLVFSTYLGGTKEDDAYAIAVDRSGNAYVTGTTSSSDFPTAGAFQPHNAGGNGDAFVAKFTANGQLAYSSYLGGTGNGDSGNAIAVDAQANVWVAGQTASTDFPVRGTPFQATLGGLTDAFVARVDATAHLVYSSYLGGSQSDVALGVAVDGSGNAYVTGSTDSTNFPTAGTPFQSVNRALNGNAFVTKVSASGTLSYSTYLGGAMSDRAWGIAVDSQGDAYVGGETGSTNFPTVAPIQSTYGGGSSDAFVTELNPAGSAAIFSSFLGGSGADFALGIATDGGGGVYLAGETGSSNLPLVRPFQMQSDPNFDNAFIAKITTYTWQGVDVAVGSDDKARLLWGTPSGSADIWSVTGAASATAGPTYGPINGWSAVDTAAGGDGSTRVLWCSDSGAAAVWLLSADGSLQNSAVFGAISGWKVQDVAVGGDNYTRVLWVNVNGAAAVWKLNSSLNITSSSIYGPLSGWTARSLAAGSSDGLLRLLWTNANGAASVWLLGADGSFQSAAVFGPISGWTAQDIAVGSDNQARVLWTTISGQAVVWSVSNSFAVSSGPLYGAYAGWQAVRLSGGSDGLIRLLWDNLNGTVALWILGSNDVYQSAGYFGPF